MKFKDNIAKFRDIVLDHDGGGSGGSSPMNDEPGSGTATPLPLAKRGFRGGFRGGRAGGRRAVAVPSPAPGSTAAGAEDPESNGIKLGSNINPKTLPMNTNSSNAFLLERCKKPVRKWHVKKREIKSFTGYKADFGLWQGDEFSGFKEEKDKETGGELKVEEVSAINSIKSTPEPVGV